MTNTPDEKRQKLQAKLDRLDEKRPRDFPRLSTFTPARISAAAVGAFAVGMGLGLAHGGKMAQLRFRAEHAHKMPETTTGWYLYHKSKNYHAMRGGLREGFRMGGRLMLWTTLLFTLEHTIDRHRRTSDMGSTIVASLAVAGGFSLWSKFAQTGPCELNVT
jgi:hypothetical protein